jgi:hypothetical protein
MLKRRLRGDMASCDIPSFILSARVPAPPTCPLPMLSPPIDVVPSQGEAAVEPAAVVDEISTGTGTGSGKAGAGIGDAGMRHSGESFSEAVAVGRLWVNSIMTPDQASRVMWSYAVQENWTNPKLIQALGWYLSLLWKLWRVESSPSNEEVPSISAVDGRQMEGRILGHGSMCFNDLVLARMHVVSLLLPGVAPMLCVGM